MCTYKTANNGFVLEGGNVMSEDGFEAYLITDGLDSQIEHIHVIVTVSSSYYVC